MSDAEYATDVEVVHRDDGYVAIKTDEDSAMGRRVLQLKPAEYDALCDETTHGDPIDDRGVYLLGDTPTTAHALATESGDGDRALLAETLADHLESDELDELIADLIEVSNAKADGDNSELFAGGDA